MVQSKAEQDVVEFERVARVQSRLEGLAKALRASQQEMTFRSQPSKVEVAPAKAQKRTHRQEAGTLFVSARKRQLGFKLPLTSDEIARMAALLDIPSEDVKSALIIATR
ncbi:MAG: hypothetical protein ABJL67_09545 [Sulfitobacter sp.]